MKNILIDSQKQAQKIIYVFDEQTSFVLTFRDAEDASPQPKYRIPTSKAKKECQNALQSIERPPDLTRVWSDHIVF